MKKVLIFVFLIGLIFSKTSLSVNAWEKLGWVEGELIITPFGPAQEGPTHIGYTDDGGGNGTMERAIGETWWTGEWHYTRADMYKSNDICSDTGRVWGWDYTKATTQYCDSSYNARTFYGQ